MWNLIKQFLITSIEANKELTKQAKRSNQYIDFLLEKERINNKKILIDLRKNFKPDETSSEDKAHNLINLISYWTVQQENVLKYQSKTNYESRNS